MQSTQNHFLQKCLQKFRFDCKLPDKDDCTVITILFFIVIVLLLLGVCKIISSTEGDPHFTVPLLSKEILCYSIQGYSGLAFNLIYNKDFIINALFVDTEGDTNEATWIGKLAVIPQNTNKSNAVVFDSVNQDVVIVGKGNLKAETIKQIIFTENDTVKFTQSVEKKRGNPTIHVVYTKPQAKFDITFYKNHLNVDWSIHYDEFHHSHGLMGMTHV